MNSIFYRLCANGAVKTAVFAVKSGLNISMEKTALHDIVMKVQLKTDTIVLERRLRKRNNNPHSVS